MKLKQTLFAISTLPTDIQMNYLDKIIEECDNKTEIKDWKKSSLEMGQLSNDLTNAITNTLGKVISIEVVVLSLLCILNAFLSSYLVLGLELTGLAVSISMWVYLVTKMDRIEKFQKLNDKVLDKISVKLGEVCQLQ